MADLVLCPGFILCYCKSLGTFASCRASSSGSLSDGLETEPRFIASAQVLAFQLQVDDNRAAVTTATSLSEDLRSCRMG